MAKIVESLLAISRLEAGEAKVQPVRLDFAELARNTADQMRLLAEEKHISLDCDGTELVEVDADPSRLKQVVVNLLDNAIKYTPDGGKVSISVTRRDGHAVLEVADSGLGVSSTDLPHIFDRFYRADKARSPQLGGTGLGLSMSLACQVEIEHSAVNRKRRKTCKWSGFAVPAGQVEFGGRIRRTSSLAPVAQLVRNN